MHEIKSQNVPFLQLAVLLTSLPLPAPAKGNA